MEVIVKDLNTLNLEKYISQALLNHLYEGIYFVDDNKEIKFWNKGAENITGYKQEEIIGKFCSDNILCHIDETGKELCNTACPLSAAIKTGSYEDKRIYLKHKNGNRIPVWVHVTPIKNTDGDIIGAVEIFLDDSDYEKLKYQANYDFLTGILNRNAIYNILKKELSRAKRIESFVSIVMIDLDHFKSINDIHGHQTGDTVLKESANVIKESLRQYDEVGRYGGEEFLVVLPNTNHNNALIIAERIRDSINNHPILIDNKTLSISASLGVSVINNNYDKLDEFINTSDKALYNAKKNGRNRIESLPFLY